MRDDRALSPLTDRPQTVRHRAAGRGPERPMTLTRRTLLRRAGTAAGGVVVVSAAGVTYRAGDDGVFRTGDGDAYTAWRDWQKGSGPQALVAAAILAANPHNSQAWTFHVTPTRIDLFADRARRTGSIDPLGRELHVGLGCCLENLMQAAAAHGYRAQLTLLPNPRDPVHVARVALTPGPTKRSALYEAIPARHTDRSEYAPRPVPPAVLAQMTALSGGPPSAQVVWFTTDDERARIGSLMVSAAQALTDDAQQSRDGFKLFRSSWADVQHDKDGLTLDAQGLSGFTTAIAKILPPYSREAGDASWVKMTRETHVKTAAAYGVITVPDPGDVAQQLVGGRLLQRIHLWTARSGLSLQHMNQITERADRERELSLTPRFGPAIQALLPTRGAKPLVTFRIGYPASQDGRRKSPRRPAADVIT